MADDASITIKLDPQTAAQLVAVAREEGVTPEQYAAELVAELVGANEGGKAWPTLSISDEDLRASIEQQRREIAAGTATLDEHDAVMAGARAILSKERGAKP